MLKTFLAPEASDGRAKTGQMAGIDEPGGNALQMSLMPCLSLEDREAQRMSLAQG